MRLIPLSQLIVGERQRKDFSAIPLAELRESILARGLIHPITVLSTGTKTEPSYKLICGERRLKAVTQIYDSGLTFRHDTKPVPAGSIPASLAASMEELEQLYLEVEENEVRANFTWQERDRALYAIHQLELARNPTQTIIATAEKIAEKGGMGQAESVHTLRKQISQASIVAQHLDDPMVAKARNSNEAFALIMQREEASINAERLRRRQARPAAKEEAVKVVCGDSMKIMPTLEAGKYNLILSDPPYGTSAGAKGFRDRTVHHHNYEDTPEAAMAAIQLLLVEGWRVTKPVANIFIFSIIDHFPFFKSQCSTMGWTPFPVPLIWQKSETEGLAPWGRNGPRRTYDVIFLAQKGGRGLLSSPTDILSVKRVHRSERIYAAQKPLDLLMQLIECATLPGESVLDPFLGSGATLAAAKRIGRVGLGIELDSQVVDIATNFIFKGELEDQEPHA